MVAGGDAMTQYAIRGAASRQLLTYQGAILVHSDRAEMEWLFPRAEVVPYDGREMPTLPISRHPGMAAVTWPLNREDFL
jgi:hypothetical protein